MTRRILPILALAALFAAAARRLVAYEIAERSMEPALRPGDWVLGIRTPRRLSPGDVVVSRDPRGSGMELVKRVAEPPGPITPDAVWLLGDNPAAGSVDSRSLGPVPRDRVTARLLLRYHPWPPRCVGRNGGRGLS